MAIKLTGTVKPKGDFPIAEAEDISMSNGKTLEELESERVAEEWEFTLDDGTVVTKKVIISDA